MRSRGLSLTGVGILLLTTGCSATGAVVFAEDAVTVDLVLTDLFLCEEGTAVPPGITARRLPSVNSCEVTGTTPLVSPPESGPTWLDMLASKQGGVWQVVVPATFLGRAEPGELDIRMDFPTPVAFAAGGATINGASVRWTDMTAARTEGIAATTHAPTSLVPAWFGPAVLGGLLGAAGAAGVRYWWRREAAGPPDEQGLPPADGPPPPVAGGTRGVVDAGDLPSDLPPEDPEIWSLP